MNEKTTLLFTAIPSPEPAFDAGQVRLTVMVSPRLTSSLTETQFGAFGDFQPTAWPNRLAALRITVRWNRTTTVNATLVDESRRVETSARVRNADLWSKLFPVG